MLTYNIDKELIKNLVNKICRNTNGFPSKNLQYMIKKIDEYKSKPPTDQSMKSARQFISEPVNDPLFEESKNVNQSQ